MINNTLNYLLAKRKPLLFSFSGAVTTSSTYLKGPGGDAGDGIPIPFAGRALALKVWDGTNMKEGSVETEFAAGDRLSLYAEYSASNFTVKLRVNGIDTTLAATLVSASTTLFATLYFILD